MSDTEMPAAVRDYLIESGLLFEVYMSGMKGGIHSTVVNLAHASEEHASMVSGMVMNTILGDPIAVEQTRQFVIDGFIHNKPEADQVVVTAYGPVPSKR